jgi:short-subunit dehydrogenase
MIAKYAVIAGASRGLGQRLASRYWKAGYNLGLVGRSVESLGQTLSALAPASSRQCDICEGDLAELASATNVAEEIRAPGKAGALGFPNRSSSDS